MIRVPGSELGSHRGGPRCMACPVARDPAASPDAGVTANELVGPDTTGPAEAVTQPHWPAARPLKQLTPGLASTPGCPAAETTGRP